MGADWAFQGSLSESQLLWYGILGNYPTRACDALTVAVLAWGGADATDNTC